MTARRTCSRCGRAITWDRGDVAWASPDGIICVEGTDPDGADARGHVPAPSISPELEAAMKAYAVEAADNAPPLAESQIRVIRNALRPEPGADK